MRIIVCSNVVSFAISIKGASCWTYILYYNISDKGRKLVTKNAEHLTHWMNFELEQVSIKLPVKMK